MSRCQARRRGPRGHVPVPGTRTWRDWTCRLFALRGGLGRLRAELLLPPRLVVGSGRLSLELADVEREILLLAPQAVLEIQQLALAALDLVLADHDVGFHAGLALLHLRLALVDLLETQSQRLLAALEPGAAL